jgi:hypothetical protein
MSPTSLTAPDVTVATPVRRFDIRGARQAAEWRIGTDNRLAVSRGAG